MTQPRKTSVVVLSATMGITMLAYLVLPGFLPAASAARPTPGFVAPMAGQVVEVEVQIEDFAFRPNVVRILPGTTVRWRNRDTALYTVTSAAGGPLNSGALLKDQIYEHQFATPGTYSYHCEFHAGMTGTVIVAYSIFLPLIYN